MAHRWSFLLVFHGGLIQPRASQGVNPRGAPSPPRSALPRGAPTPLGFFLGLLISSALALTTACNSCNSDPFARLVSAQGEVTRDYKATQNQWTAAALGAEFDLGDALHTGETSAAEVRFDDGATLKLQAVTTVRFLAVAPNSGELGIDVETGEAVLQTGGTLRLRTGIGLAVIEGGSTLRLARSDRGLKFLVSVGMARLIGDNGVTEIRAGEGLEVGIGMAILDRLDTSPTATPAPRGVTSAANSDLRGPITAEIRGKGALIQAPGGASWQPLAEGTAVIARGSRIKLSSKNEAIISREGQSATLTGRGIYVVGGEGLGFVQPEVGTTELNADGKDLTLLVPGGTVTALGSQGVARGWVALKKDGQLSVKVNRGRFRARLNGREATLEAGEALESTTKDFSIVGRSLGFADIETTAGAGLMVHDPAPPTAVRVDFKTKCPFRGVVELVNRKRVTATAVGKHGANLHFPVGTNSYQVRCLSEEGELSAPTAEGRVIIYADTGTAALAKHPPATSIKVDGRGYTVLYQNRLPAISVRWPNAPSATSYTLTVKSPYKSQRITTGQPARSFTSGSLTEGDHRFTFQADNGRTSRTTSVSIRFDNAAPKGSIQSPSDGSFGPGGSVRVAGLALPGWKVSVGDSSFPMDAQRRFSGQVTAGPRAVVLRFEHESRGVHYYLRRASGIPR